MSAAAKVLHADEEDRKARRDGWKRLLRKSSSAAGTILQELERNEGGEGIHVTVRVHPCGELPAPEQFVYEGPHGAGKLDYEPDRIARAWSEQVIGPFIEALESNAEGYVYRGIRFRKWRERE